MSRVQEGLRRRGWEGLGGGLSVEDLEGLRRRGYEMDVKPWLSRVDDEIGAQIRRVEEEGS